MIDLPKLVDLDVKDKKVFLRVDLDVPVHRVQGGPGQGEEFEVVDEDRIQEVVPTVKALLGSGSRSIVLAAHLGHEVGVGALTTSAVLGTLEKLIGEKVVFCPRALEEGGVDDSLDGQGRIKLLENLRKYPGEEANERVFCERLSSFGDIYVNESFAVSHRMHASVVGVPRLMKSQGRPVAAGLRFCEEVGKLSQIIDAPKRPLVVVIGGAKIETKLPIISRMEQFADKVLVGGKLPSEVAAEGLKFSDKVLVGSLSENGKDIDEETIRRFIKEIGKAESIVWNGPMGMFEVEGGEMGTSKMVEVVENSEGFKVAGGGDTEAAIRKFGSVEKFDWVSIGGGAMMQFLANGTLPGIEALID